MSDTKSNSQEPARQGPAGDGGQAEGDVAALATPGPDGLDALGAALALHEQGYWPILIRPQGHDNTRNISKGKEPFGKGWGLERWTPERLRQTARKLEQIRAHQKLTAPIGCGICLGPGRAPCGQEDEYLVDLEGDGPDAAESLARLFSGETVESVGWSSTRGSHLLGLVTRPWIERVIACYRGREKDKEPGVFHFEDLPELELRVGGYKTDGQVKQVQSVVPPTPGTDGVPRQWNGVWALARFPEIIPPEFTPEPEPAPRPEDQGPSPGPAPTNGQGTPQAAWFRAALEDECRAVAETPEGKGPAGGRRNRLRNAAYALGGHLHHGYLIASSVRTALIAAGNACGLPEGEVVETVDDGLRDGQANPLSWPDQLTRPGDNGRPATTGHQAVPIGANREHQERGPKGGAVRGKREKTAGPVIYLETPDGLALDDGDRFVLLTNFTAHVVEEITRDQGDSLTKELAIAMRLQDGTALTANVPAKDYNAMDWVIARFGPRARILAGRGLRDHARDAIQAISTDIRQRTVREFMGWTPIDGQWVYLHGRGGLGASGNDPTLAVELPGKLAKYQLPDPPDRPQDVEAVRAVLRLLDLGQKDRLHSRPLAAASFCIPFRAILGDSLCTPWFEGETGVLKTELAGNILMRFFGNSFSRTEIPTGWDSTFVGMTDLSFKAKDALFLIDDFKPPAAPSLRAKYEEVANLMLRCAAERRGRDRGRTDGSVAISRVPRGMLASTGETIPTGSSALGRALVVPIVKGTLDSPLMRDLSALGASGMFARAAAGYIRWLAPHYETTRQGLEAKTRARQDEWTRRLAQAGVEMLHARTVENAADLSLGGESFLDYAVSIGVLEAEEADRKRATIASWLQALAAGQTGNQRAVDPVDRTFRLLTESLAQGAVFLADARPPGDQAPAGLEAACGWTNDPHADGLRWTPHPGGRKIGWISGDRTTLYLLPEIAYAAAQSVAHKQGETIALPVNTLSTRLKDRHYLVKVDPTRAAFQKKIAGVNYWVWALATDRLIDSGPAGDDAAD